MKFKFIGETGSFDIIVIVAGALPEKDRILEKDKIYDIPEDAKTPDGRPLIPRLQASTNGNWEQVKQEKKKKGGK
jgi:hypothetical protein